MQKNGEFYEFGEGKMQIWRILAEISQNIPNFRQNLGKISKNQLKLVVGRIFYGAEYWTGEESRGRKKDGF